MQDWNGHGAIVTGGASGLGAATAQKLSDDGLKVAVFDLDAARGRAHAKKIGGSFVQVDVSDPSSVSSGIAEARKSVGVPRVLVNCAGIGGAARTVSRGEPHDPALFEKILRVNLFGSFNCASQVAAVTAGADPVDADGARGVIVNTASVAAFDGQIGQTAYAASKGGIASMTLPMARDLANRGVRVITIAPGLFLTPLLHELPAEVRDSLGAQAPFPSRLGDPVEFAEMVADITRNPMLNGEVVRLDGALRMAPR